MNAHFPLIGDPEIDGCLPNRPQVLPEITWIPLSSRRALAAGSLGATLVPTRIGNIGLFELLTRLDGSRTLLEVIEGDEGDIEGRRKYVKLLFSAGLIEESCNDGLREPAAFHALAMDQTRLHNDRRACLAHGRRPLLLVAAPPSLANALAKAGLNLSTDPLTPGLAFQLLVLEPDASPYGRDAFLHSSIPQLPLRLHGSSVDIGPWLPTKGGSRLRDLQRHAADHAATLPADDECLLYALAAHAVGLIVAGLSPIVMASVVQRIRLDDGGPVVEEIPISPLLNDMAPGVSPELAARLASRARSAMPSLRHVGRKAHEAHYAPRNIHAAFEIQEGAHAPVSRLPSLGATRSMRLLRILSAAFGFGRDGGELRRRCPSGGNLGSPEPLLWVAAENWLWIYRYLPATEQLECVGNARAHMQGSPEIGVMCLGNHEKAIRKYGDFGRNLIHLDGGVARAVLLIAARGEGFGCQPDPDCLHRHPLLSRLLAARSSYYTTLWSVRLASSRTACLDLRTHRTRKWLSQQLAARRAQRHFDGSGTSPGHFSRLVRKACPVPIHPIEAVLLAEIKVMLRVREDRTRRWLRLHRDGRFEALPDSRDGPELFLQGELDKAPFALFFMTSLAPLLELHGEEAFDTLLLLCGHWVGNLWLSLHAAGLGGCPCGAAVESDVQAALPAIFDRDSLLFSFVAGAQQP